MYQSSLLPERRRRRVSPWLVVPGLFLVFGAALYYLLYGPRPRRAVPTAGRVIYAATLPGGASQLWTAPAAPGGEAPKLLGGSLGGDSAPAFSADGNQIAFLSAPTGGLNQVFLADADGQGRIQLTRTAGAKSLPAFAPGSDTLLAFLSGPTLAVQAAGKGDASILLPAPAQQNAQSGGTDTAPAPDAGAAAVVGYAWRPGPDKGTPGLAATLETAGGQTLALLPALSDAPLLTRGGDPKGPPLVAADAVSCAWSPDGSRLAAALLRAQAGAGQPPLSGLFLLDAQGTPQKPLFLTPPGGDIGPENPVFSPDGLWIAFELWRQPDLARRVRLGLYVVPAGGGTPVPLARGDAGGARFSPDSASVFFLAARPGGGHDLKHDLKRIAVTGGKVETVSDGHADVSGFAFSPQPVSAPATGR